MKRILLCLMVALFATGCLFAKNNDEKMNVMSYNIRYDNSGDKDNQWKFRRDFAADLVKFYEADVFGAQEVLNNQLNDLLNRLPEYAYVGVGREDGKTKGEYAPIFYRKDRFSVEKSGNFWLAEDINAIGKKGWDAACERVATWAILKDKNTGKKFFFLNTHLDHMGKVARHEGASLMRFLKKWTGKTFIDNLNEIRVAEAVCRLTDTSDSISEICYRCGFNNLSNFNRVFKRRRGSTPTEYREKYSRSRFII